jgi:dephospho-CoA kinase
MLLVALTGGIATGKSYVRSRFASRGIPTIDSDAVVHELMAPGGALVDAIAARFGAAMVRSDGGIDRRSLGRLVFADPAARSDLEALVHPLVYDRIRRWAEVQRKSGVSWAVADIPLLFETGREGEFDAVIVTACLPATQVRRMAERDGVEEGDARARLAAQWPIDEKVRRADYVIRTDGTFEETDRQVDAVIADTEEKCREQK